MKEPRTKWRQRPGLKIVMNKSLSGFAIVPVEKGDEVFAAKMVQHSCGNINVAVKVGGKRVSVKETAGKCFRRSKAIPFLDQS